MTKLETLKAPIKSNQLRDYDEILRRVVADAKREQTEVEHRLLLAKNNLFQVQEQIVRQQSEFEKWKRAETEKFNQDKNKRENNLIERDRALRINEDNAAKRTQEVEVREAKAKLLIDERTTLALERIDVQKLHSKAEQMIRDAHNKLAEADNKYHKASMLETSIKDRETRLELAQKNFTNREEVVNAKSGDIKAREKNIEEIRKVIDPRIEELKLKEDSIKRRESEIAKKEIELNAKLEEQRAIPKALEGREKKIKEREKELLQREEEIMRKALMANIKD